MSNSPTQPAQPTPRDVLKQFLPEGLTAAAGEFVNSTLWLAFKRALQARRTANALVEDQPHVAAAKGFKANGWDECLEALENLPFETPPVNAPVIPTTLIDQRD